MTWLVVILDLQLRTLRRLVEEALLITGAMLVGILSLCLLALCVHAGHRHSGMQALGA